MKNTRKKIGNILGFTFLSVFFLMNTVAFNHARKFTRFSEPDGGNRTRLDELSSIQKAGIIFSGVNNPKPVNDSVPHFPYETIELGTERKLHCWFIPADSARGTVILYHGYSAHKSQLVPHAEIFRNLGWNALLVDFYGTGGSAGNESTVGYREAEDVKTSFDYVKSKSDKPIVLYGVSMGSAAVMKAVSEKTVEPDKIILECPFGSMRSAVDVRVGLMGAPRFPFTDLFMLWGGALNGFWTYSHNPADYAKKIEIPTLLLYGELDNKVPMAETQQIFENLKGSKNLVTFPESGHESYLKKYEPEWTAETKAFLNP